MKANGIHLLLEFFLFIQNLSRVNKGGFVGNFFIYSKLIES